MGVPANHQFFCGNFHCKPSIWETRITGPAGCLRHMREQLLSFAATDLAQAFGASRMFGEHGSYVLPKKTQKLMQTKVCRVLGTSS